MSQAAKAPRPEIGEQWMVKSRGAAAVVVLVVVSD